MSLRQILDDFFRTRAPLGSDDSILVAFSGGPDSCCLLAGLKELTGHRPFRILAAHLDHGLDVGSGERAEAARKIAARLGVPFLHETRPVSRLQGPGESLEVAARRVRYEVLEELRLRHGARYLATAHHRDDQAETVLLRMIYGSGLDGLAGILPVRGHLVRPLLGLTRAEIEEELQGRSLTPVRDPTNRDEAVERNRLRRRLLPALEADEPNLRPLLARLARAAAAARTALDRRLQRRLGLRRIETSWVLPPGSPGASMDLGAYRRLPEVLQEPALALLARRAGAPYPVSRGGRGELRRQLLEEAAGTAAPIGLDAGGGWRLESRDQRLELLRPETPMPFFSYTFRVPGALEVPELGARIQLRRSETGEAQPGAGPEFASLRLPLRPGESVTVRNRRPGDRIRAGRSRSLRKLKDLFIDHKIPRRVRDRIPLLCLGRSVVWIPGLYVLEPVETGAGGPGRDLETWTAEIAKVKEP